MPHPELFILRHGQTEWNAEGRIQGHRESVLTALGRRQAAAQGRILKRAGLPAGTRFHCSTAIRARQTARIALAGIAGAEALRLDPRLREIGLGACEGLLREECRQRWPGLFDEGAPLPWLFRAPGGEGLGPFRARLAGWLAEQDGPAVVIAHGVVSKLLRGLALSLSLSESMALPGGQGVVWHLKDGAHRCLAA